MNPASTAATAASPVGNYNIVPALADPGHKLGNYLLSASNGTLTIGQTPLSVAAANQTRLYGQSNPTLTGLLTGTVNDDNITASYGTAATTASPAGAYSIAPSLNDPQGKLANYSVSSSNGTLLVTTAPLVVSANNQSRLYGATNPVLTVAYSGFANGEGPGILSGQPALSTAAGATSPVGNYDIVVGLGGLSATNYSFSLTNGTLTVGKALLTVTADNQVRFYGQTNPAFTVHYSGYVDGDNQSVLSGAPALSTAADTNTPVGGYDIVVTNGNLSATNYALGFVNGALTINAAALAITAHDATRQYGATNPAFTFTIQGFVNGQDSTALSGALLLASTATAGSAVGVYAIVPSGWSSTNYALNFTNGSLTVSPAALTAAVNNTNRVYGQANPAFTGACSGALNGNDLGIRFGTQAVSSSPAGQYAVFPIFADPADKLGNYLVTTNSATLTVTPALLTVTADGQTRAYGQPNPLLTVHYSGFAGADGPTNLTAQPAASTPANPASFIGQYPISASGGSSSNYLFSYVAGTLTVQQANLIIVGADAARAYGQTNPAFTSTITGLANGDDMTVSYETLAIPASRPGNYDIVLQINDPDGMLGEYDLTLVSGTLTVTNAALIVTADNQNRLYGQANPPFTVHYNGFVNGQGTNLLTSALTFSCLAALNTPAGANTAAGSYPITAAGLAATNYTLQYVAGTLTIAKAPLNITATSTQRTYGASNPAFTATFSGFVNGESRSVLGGTLSLTSPAVATSPTGAYAIIPGGLTSGNYSLNFTNGSLTVTPAELTGAVLDAGRAYGQGNPAFSVSYQGFVNHQNSGIVSGPIEYSCLDTNRAGVDTNTPVGVYPIHVTTPQTASNYTIGYVDGTLTVAQAVLLVTADNQSRLYGDANPALTFAYSGFVNAEDTNVIGGQPDLSTAAGDNSPAGSYDIVVGPGGLSATNYSFSLTDGALTVGQALLTVTADNQVRLYGQTNPAFTAQFSGFVAGDDPSVLSGVPALSTVADTNTPVGTYNIVAANGNLAATSYALNFVNGTLTINAAALTITANDATRQYGTANPVFTDTMQGFVNGEDATALAGTLSLASSADASSPVGAYAIVPSGLSSINYALSCANGTLTVTQALLTVSANSAIRQYGTANPAFRGTMSELCNGDPITASYNCAATQSSPAQSYAIVPCLNDPGSKAANYAVTLQNGTLTITVALAPATTSGFYVVGSAPVFTDTSGLVTDGGNLGFGGGLLAITIVTNATAMDVLGIEPQGNGTGQIGVQAPSVTWGGALFATFSGGNGLSPLVFLLNTNATAESVSALMRQLTFSTASTNSNYRVIQTALTIGGNTLLAEYVLTLDRPPVAGDCVITAAEGETIQIAFSRVLTNVYDADSNSLTITDCSAESASGGWVGADGTSFTYIPPPGWTGRDQFAFLVEDGQGGQCVGMIIINCRPKYLLQIDTSNVRGAGASLTMAGRPGSNYQIQASTNLVDWVNLGAVTADAEGIIQILDTAAKDHPQRFYRAKAQ